MSQDGQPGDPRQHASGGGPGGATEQASMIRRYIIRRNNHAYHERLHLIVDRAT